MLDICAFTGGGGRGGGGGYGGGRGKGKVWQKYCHLFTGVKVIKTCA